jgi:hypothetical protein
MKRRAGNWRPWENIGKMLREWLRGNGEEWSRGKGLGREVELAMQYIWYEKSGVPGVLEIHDNSKEGHEAFLERHPGVVGEDVKSRWVEMGIFLEDGGNKAQSVYKTEKEIFCRNILVNLYDS